MEHFLHDLFLLVLLWDIVPDFLEAWINYRDCTSSKTKPLSPIYCDAADYVSQICMFRVERKEYMNEMKLWNTLFL